MLLWPTNETSAAERDRDKTSALRSLADVVRSLAESRARSFRGFELRIIGAAPVMKFAPGRTVREVRQHIGEAVICAETLFKLVEPQRAISSRAFAACEFHERAGQVTQCQNVFAHDSECNARGGRTKAGLYSDALDTLLTFQPLRQQ